LIAQIEFPQPTKHFERIRENLKLAFPKNTILIVPDTLKLSVAGPEEIEKWHAVAKQES
jgi:hypothetical protein